MDVPHRQGLLGGIAELQCDTVRAMHEVNERTLYVGWQDRAKTRQWFPVGRLDADLAEPRYRFSPRQGSGASPGDGRIRSRAGVSRTARRPTSHAELFPVFQNRVMSPRRPDFEDYLKGTGSQPHGRSDRDPPGGRWAPSVTDFFRGVSEARQEPMTEPSCVAFFFTVFATQTAAARGEDQCTRSGRVNCTYRSRADESDRSEPAVQIQTKDYFMIGWAPRITSRTT